MVPLISLVSALYFSQCIVSNKNCNLEWSEVCSRLTKWRTKTITNDSCVSPLLYLLLPLSCQPILISIASDSDSDWDSNSESQRLLSLSLSFVAVAVCHWFHLFKIPFEKFKLTGNWHPLANEWINDWRRLVWPDFSS